MGTEAVGFAVLLPVVLDGLGSRRVSTWKISTSSRSGAGEVSAVSSSHMLRRWRPSVVAGGLSWSVLNWNESAIRFYRSLGAEQIRDSLSFRLMGTASRSTRGRGAVSQRISQQGIAGSHTLAAAGQGGR